MLKTLVFCLTCALLPASVWAELMEFEAADFTVTPTFSNVQTFQFSIDLGESPPDPFIEPFGIYGHAISPDLILVFQ